MRFLAFCWHSDNNTNPRRLVCGTYQVPHNVKANLPFAHASKAPLQRCLWCQWRCAQGPRVRLFTIAAKELHICGGYSHATVVQRSPCRGPPKMLPLMWPCGTVHTHGRHIDSEGALHNKKNACIFSQGAPVTGCFIPICASKEFPQCPCKVGLPEILCHAKLP